MEIKRSKLKSKLNNNLYLFVKNDYYLIENIKPENLLNANRFDLLAKYIYVKFKDRNIQSNFAKKLYLKHISVFNGFVENDESKKIGKQAFLNSFDDIICSIKKSGIQEDTIIPISNDNCILDGAHRLAASLYFKKELPVVNLIAESPKYNYEFFRNRGLDAIYLDAMAYEYLKLKNENIYMILIWPTSGGRRENELIDILDKYGDIVYRKNVELSKLGEVQIIKQAYKTEDWLGNNGNGFIGAKNKARWCFDKKGPLRVILFESIGNMIEMKDEIRAVFKVEKHSVHITDNMSEACELAGIFFNDNSLNWLNYSLLKDFPWFKKLFSHYKEWINNENLNKEFFCVDGSSSMAAYGIREIRDLDFLYGGKDEPRTGFKEIGCHNNEMKYHDLSCDEIIFNPHHHFYFNSFKFSSIESLNRMKLNRGEAKDLDDSKKITLLLDKNLVVNTYSEMLTNILQFSFWKGKIKFYLLKIRYYLVILKSKYISS